jgi:hypothetical protein
MTTLNVSPVGFEELSATLAAKPEKLRLAKKRAITRTAKHLATQAKKALATTEGIKPAAVKNRAASKMLADTGLVWVGLNPMMPVHLAGGIRQDASGVTAGSRTYRGAFFRRVYGSERKVWIRIKSRHYDPDLYFHKPHGAQSVDKKLRHRFPVALASVKLDTDAVRRAIGMEATAAGPYLLDLLARELAYRSGQA